MWISSHVEHHCLSQWHRKLWIWQKYGPHYLLLFEYWKVGLLWSFSMLSHLVKMLSTKWLSLNFKLAYFNIYLLKRFCTFLICIFFFLKKIIISFIVQNKNRYVLFQCYYEYYILFSELNMITIQENGNGAAFSSGKRR